MLKCFGTGAEGAAVGRAFDEAGDFFGKEKSSKEDSTRPVSKSASFIDQNVLTSLLPPTSHSREKSPHEDGC